MASQNPLAGLKVDIWMPLDIGRFLQDTIHLNAQQIGSYLLLLMRYWGEGALPNDPEELAITARVSGDTWSKTQVVLSRYFQVAPDGLLHQAGADRRRAAWIDKRLKAREKAIKAITARWSKHKAKLASTGNTPSTAQVIPENYPSPVVQEQKQKQPPPTPSAARRGIEPAQAAPLGEPPPAPAAAPAPAPRSAGPGGAGARAGRSAAPAGGGKGKKSETIDFAPLALPKRADGGLVSPNSNGRSNGRRGLIATHDKNGVNGAKPDRRQVAFKDEVLAYWKGQNPGGPNYKWATADERALAVLLIRCPDLTMAGFKKLLHNRAESAVNPSAMPHKWLRNLVEYSSGRLGKFGRPAESSRNL